MMPEQFCYWLQGFVEIGGGDITEQQWKAIRDHLKLVFVKETPEYGQMPDFNKALRPGLLDGPLPVITC